MLSLFSMVLTVLRSTGQVFKFLLHLFMYLLCCKHVHACVWILVCHSTHVAIRGQSMGVCSFLPCGFWGSNTGHQTWQQEPLPTKLSHKTLNSGVLWNLAWLELL